MGRLLLNSLEIRNFRGFHNLQIGKLGRVNLIVGKNNIGKSSLLEALELYARRGNPTFIWQFLRGRNEFRNMRVVRNDENPEDLLVALKYLFYGRKDIKDAGISISIGPMRSPEETLSIAVNWFTREVDPQEGGFRWQALQADEYLTADNPIPRFVISLGQSFKMEYLLQTRPFRLRPLDKEISCVSVGAGGLSSTQAASLWDKVTLTALDAEVLSALQIVAPGVMGLSFIGDEDDPARFRVPLIRVKGEEPLPLGSLGNGMLRVLGITLALANAKDGILLVDEIENGIHYTVQQELWKLIFRLARQLNIQVFATTHNWDCIEAFQKAAEEDKQEEGMLIRLSLKKGEVVATLFDEEELQIATREGIEVR